MPGHLEGSGGFAPMRVLDRKQLQVDFSGRLEVGIGRKVFQAAVPFVLHTQVLNKLTATSRLAD